jgi:hypothetical protein
MVAVRPGRAPMAMPAVAPTQIMKRMPGEKTAP